MPRKALGNKCLVDTFKIYNNETGEEKSKFHPKNAIFVEMDGFSWDSSEYDTLQEFLQSIIDHSYRVAMGKE